MLVSVIVPVYNDRLRLELCLTALQSQTYSNFEILVVDNNSTENIYSVCEKFPNVCYLFEPTPGNNAARNCGIQYAAGEVIAITDSDCVPDVDWLKQGAKLFETHPEVGLMGGHIQFFFKGKKPTVAEYVDSICYLQQETYITRDHYAAGANLLVRREVFEQVGGFDDRLMNLGDKEFGQRVYESGWLLAYVANAIVFHPARPHLKALLTKLRRQIRAQHKLSALTGTQLPRCSFLPYGVRFFRNVWNDRNLPGWREKLTFAWIMHWMKWIAAWELSITRPKHQ
ncbi:glycosyltransferase family A protein [Leptolyngbya sp. ST-U4]|uniref:glycosyltransferase n=1 Tax=Leptolyngbya sp. ST-U4 TaxID=2933912 RepID=UPI003298FA83